MTQVAWTGAEFSAHLFHMFLAKFKESKAFGETSVQAKVDSPACDPDSDSCGTCSWHSLSHEGHGRVTKSRPIEDTIQGSIAFSALVEGRPCVISICRYLVVPATGRLYLSCRSWWTEVVRTLAEIGDKNMRKTIALAQCHRLS